MNNAVRGEVKNMRKSIMDSFKTTYIMQDSDIYDEFVKECEQHHKRGLDSK